MALAMACLFAAGLRVRGKGGTPPQHGGWRELDLPADGSAGGAPIRSGADRSAGSHDPA